VVKNGARRLVGRKIIVCEHELEWNMVHFDVQLIGGIALHQGRIAEMATGEGKTLVATLPLYLNCPHRPQRPARHGQRLPRPPRLRVDGPPLHLSRRHRRLHPAADALRTCAGRCTAATSPTAPPASSASTTCATTAWPPARRTRSSATTGTASWTRSTPSSSTRPAPPHHLRPGPDRARAAVHPAQARGRPAGQRPDPPLQRLRQRGQGAAGEAGPDQPRPGARLRPQAAPGEDGPAEEQAAPPADGDPRVAQAARQGSRPR
jgi:hypothetical protein